ncbi:Crp/Fnr family transcriptional regulator [Oxalobacteraceae bacterium A2-2]
MSVPPRNDGEQSCAACVARQLCMGEAGAGCIQEIARLVVARHCLQRGEALYQAGDAVQDRFYAVCGGAFKLYQLDGQLRQRVAAFAQAGNYLGLEAGELEYHAYSAVALEPALVCEFSTRAVERAARAGLLCGWLEAATADTLRQRLAVTRMLRGASAAQRLAGMLLELSQGMSMRGQAALQLRLPMSRQDMADYLGLTGETVSRLLGRMRKAGCLEIGGSRLSILDPGRLRRIAAGAENEQGAVLT